MKANKMKNINVKFSLFGYGCVRLVQQKFSNVFSKPMFSLGVGWIHFYKTTPRQTNRMFDYGGLFVKLMGMQLFINKH
jgi:hypothetical protein